MNKVTCGYCGEVTEEVNERVGLHGDPYCPGSVCFVGKELEITEDRYTEANDWCPHPERWHSVDWDSAEIEVSNLVAAFARATRASVIVETGTAFAQTAKMIGEALPRKHTRKATLYTVEIDPKRAEGARELCEGLPVEVICQDSMSWTPPPGIGFAWFDSLPHLRVPEFRRYYPQMAPGAIVGFHDTAPHFPLWPQIEKLEEEGLLLPIRLRTPRGVVFGEVV